MHILDLGVVPLELAKDHLLVLAIAEFSLYLLEVAHDFRQLVRICLLAARLFQKLLCLVSELINLVVEHFNHGL